MVTVGRVDIFSPEVTLWLSASLPPFPSNVTLNFFIVHLGFNFLPSISAEVIVPLSISVSPSNQPTKSWLVDVKVGRESFPSSFDTVAVTDSGDCPTTF